MPSRESLSGANRSAPTKLSKSPADKYRIVTKFAVGGMGEIFIAMDNNCRRQVIVKVMRDNLVTGLSTYRFIIEAQITAQLEHPNIVPVHDLSLDENDRLFYSMKKVQGVTLLQVLSKLKRGDPEYIDKFPLDRLLNIFQDVCDAIAFAHSKGVVHRDLKPENIMVGDYGEVLVLDWGIAKVLETSPLRKDVESCMMSMRQIERSESKIPMEKSTGTSTAGESCAPPSTITEVLTAEPTADMTDVDLLREPETAQSNVLNDTYGTFIGDVFGTMGYMSPEQRVGRVDELDARSDVFSLGVILYFVLSLRLPFRHKQPEELYQDLKIFEVVSPADLGAKKLKQRDLGRVPEPIHCPGKRVPSALSAVAMKAMALSSENRYQSVADLQDDIRKYQAGFATSAEDAGALRLLLLLVNRHRVLAASAFIIVALTIVFMLQVMKSEGMARYQQGLAEKHAAAAKVESLRAKQQLAQSLIAEGNALGALDKWGHAAEKYRRSFDILETTHRSTFPAQLGLWNAFRNSPPPITTFAGHTSPVLSIAVSQTGDVGVSGSSDGRLIVWDLKTGRKTAELSQSDHASPVVSIAITHDNRNILSGHYDGSIIYWDVNNGNKVNALHGHSRWINDLSLSPAPDIAASAGADGLVFIWDLTTGEKIVEIDDHEGGAIDLIFSADGSSLLTGGVDRSVRLWSTNTGEQLQRFDGNEAAASTVIFGAAEKTIISGNLNGVVRLWDMSTGEEKSRLKGKVASILDIKASRDGGSIVCAHQDLSLTRWDISKQARIWEKRSPGWTATDFSFSATGEIALTNGPGFSLNLLAPDATRGVKTLSGHTGAIVCAAFSSDDQLIVSGGWDKTIKLWDAATGMLLKTLSGHDRAVTSIAFVGNNRKVVSTSLDGTLRIWDLFSGENRSIELGYGPILDAIHSQSQGCVLFSNRKGKIIVWDLATNLRQRELIGKGPIRGLSFSPDGTLAAAINSDGTVLIWSAPDFGVVRELLIEDARTAAFSPDAAWIVIGTRSGKLETWDIRKGIRTLVYQSTQSSEITQLSYSPQGRYLYSVNRAGFLQVWDTGSGELVGEFSEHERPITALAVSSDGNQIATGGRDKVIKHWDLTTPIRYSIYSDELTDVIGDLSSFIGTADSYAAAGEWFSYRGLTEWAIEFLGMAQDMGRSDVALNLGRCYWYQGLRESAASNFNYAKAHNLAPLYYLKLCEQALNKSFQRGQM